MNGEQIAARGPVAVRSGAFVRAVLVVAIGAGALIDDRPGLYGTGFVALLAVAAAYSAALLTLPFPPRRWSSVYAVLDLALLAALAHASGGAASEVRFAFFAIPVLAAMVFRPRDTAIASAAVVLVYLSLALPSPGAELVYLAWAAVAAVILSTVLTHRADAIERLARDRRRLMVEALAAEDRERRRLADWLHDGAVQTLLVAAQELADAERGDAVALRRARDMVRATVPQLRSVLLDLHPGPLTPAGLAGALRELAGAHARRGSFQVDVSVEERAEGVHDQLVLSLARELLTNVVKHARARHVSVRVCRDGDAVVLEVRDDGCGFDPTCITRVVADGHIGLASSVERVESLGGRMEIEAAPESGTRVRAAIPVG